uniref:DUF551 domain-containing protein n=1 Tax=viral metagenome TaxID=1070528 RepID=A0A6H1ZW55_9ZZZZ
MNLPSNSRDVLTWTRDSEGSECWLIDFYMDNCWFEATAWELEVLYWQELPPKPEL